MDPLALYVHVPFCVRKCAYCDFNAYSGMGELAGEYVAAACEEIRRGPDAGRPLSTVFFGGGTPTYLTASQLAAIMDAIRGVYAVAPDAEITAEANPTSVDAGKFAAMREAGFNRLSIGVQSFDDRLLQAVDREHSAFEAESAIRGAREAGFPNVSLDLMFGLPGQSLTAWAVSLDRAISLRPEHLSTYALTIEPGTRFERLHAGGRLDLPGEDEEGAMYEWAIERLARAGYEHYEVSNFALPEFRCRHNLVYWRNGEYLGFGPGAVSYLGGRRWTNEKHPALYIRKVQAGADLAVDSEELAGSHALWETLTQGLRLREGVAVVPLVRRHGTNPLDQFAAPLRRLAGAGLVEVSAEQIRLTHRGLLFANDVFLELMPD